MSFITTTSQWCSSRSIAELASSASPKRVYHSLMSRFDVMIVEPPRHQYQVLTKRPERMAQWLTRMQESGAYEPASHIWLGTSVENNLVTDRAAHLRETPAGVRFLSCEPLLGPLDELCLDAIDWVILGGESGTHLWDDRARRRRGLVEYLASAWEPREERALWVQELRDRCVELGIPFFFKQWGGSTSKAGGRELRELPAGSSRASAEISSSHRVDVGGQSGRRAFTTPSACEYGSIELETGGKSE